MTGRLKRFVSSLLPGSVSAFSISFHIFEGVRIIEYSSGGKVMIICLLLNVGNILEHRRDRFVLSFVIGRDRVRGRRRKVCPCLHLNGCTYGMCVCVCPFYIKEILMERITSVPKCSPFFF